MAGIALQKKDSPYSSVRVEICLRCTRMYKRVFSMFSQPANSFILTTEMTLLVFG